MDILNQALPVFSITIIRKRRFHHAIPHHPPNPACFDADSRILILGSFPSVKSGKAVFFYGHPQNRFWKLLARLRKEDVPSSIEEKKEFLLRNHIAVRDTIHSCSIEGSSDSSIRDVVPNDLASILDHASIQAIYTNGGLSGKMYDRFCRKQTGIEAIKLPSTSPANAAWNLDRLTDAWKCINQILGNPDLKQKHCFRWQRTRGKTHTI